MLIGGDWVDGRERAAHRRREPVAARGARRRSPAAAPRTSTARSRAAAAAFPAWRALPARDRGLLLTRIADDLAGIGEELARIIAAETGNAIRTQARGEAATAADVFRYFGGVASEQKGEVLPLGDGCSATACASRWAWSPRSCPGTRPSCSPSLKVAMALGTGNTLVLKAAEDAPLGVLRMAEVCAEPPARGRPQRRHGLRRGVRRGAAQPPGHREDLLHRLDRGRADRDARRGRAHPARVAGARRQGARDRLPGLRRRRHGRRT